MSTVRDWISRRQPKPPEALTRQVFAALGANSELPDSQTGDVCLTAASRALDALLTERRFGRESAADLLAVDALTTYAFEHSCQTASSAADIEAMARRGAALLGQLTTARV